MNRFDREGLRDIRRACVGEKPTPDEVLHVARYKNHSPQQIRPRLLQFPVESAAIEDGHLQIAHDQIVRPFPKLPERDALEVI